MFRVDPFSLPGPLQRSGSAPQIVDWSRTRSRRDGNSPKSARGQQDAARPSVTVEPPSTRALKKYSALLALRSVANLCACAAPMCPAVSSAAALPRCGHCDTVSGLAGTWGAGGEGSGDRSAVGDALQEP